jgi:hypothetical protein
MIINYYTKSVFGQEREYLANSNQKNIWHSLTGKMTIDYYDRANMEKLFGVTFNRVFEAEA